MLEGRGSQNMFQNECVGAGSGEGKKQLARKAIPAEQTAGWGKGDKGVGWDVVEG